MSFKKFITLLLSLLMVISMTACSGGGGGETPEPSGETKYKTTFTYAVGGEPTYMDPAKCGDSVTAEIHNEIWYPLFYLTETGAVANGDVRHVLVVDPPAVAGQPQWIAGNGTGLVGPAV